MGYEYPLQSVGASLKSFRGAPKVIVQNNGDKRLISYMEHVATISTDGYVTLHGRRMQKTALHIREFLLQEGFEVRSSIDEMFEKYVK